MIWRLEAEWKYKRPPCWSPSVQDSRSGTVVPSFQQTLRTPLKNQDLSFNLSLWRACCDCPVNNRTRQINNYSNSQHISQINLSVLWNLNSEPCCWETLSRCVGLRPPRVEDSISSISLLPAIHDGPWPAGQSLLRLLQPGQSCFDVDRNFWTIISVFVHRNVEFATLVESDGGRFNNNRQMGIKIFGQNILKGVKHDNNLAVFWMAVQSSGQTCPIRHRGSLFSKVGTKQT